MECEGIYSCFLDAATPSSDYNIGTTNIKLNHITLTSTNYMKLAALDPTYLITLTGLNTVYLSDVTFLDNSNTDILTVSSSSIVIINEGICGRGSSAVVEHFADLLNEGKGGSY